MRIALFTLAVSTLLIAGCGGSSTGTVKGKVVENGQAKTFPPTSHAVMFTLIGPNGDLDMTKSFTAVVEEDGSFEVHASGGMLPVGTYEVTIQTPTKKGSTTKTTPPKSKREVKSGENVFTLDLLKADG